MKQYIVSLLTALPFMAYSQCEPNGVSTHPDAPVNNQAPSALWLNDFKWYDSQGLTLIQYVLHDMFIFNNQVIMSHPYSDQNTYPYLTHDATGTSYTMEELDMYPEDGWELISLNMGVYPNGELLSDQVPPEQTSFGEIPYLLLYNKQRGILRLFANSLTGLTNNAYDAVRVTLRFASAENNSSGLLRHNNGKDRALDQITEVTEISTVVDHPNNSALWFHVDFQVGYDPCTCWYQSDIALEFSFIDTQDIRMTSRGVHLDVPLLDPNNNAFIDNNFLSSVDFSDGWAGSGMVIYNTMDNMIDDYIARLEYVKEQNILIAANNEEINRKLAIMKAFKEVIVTGVVMAGTAILTGPTGAAVATSAPSIITGASAGGVVISKAKLQAEAKKILGLGYDWLMNQVKKGLQQELKPPPMPTATMSETTFDGEIWDADIVVGPSLYNPGTYPDATGFAPVSAHNYPVYNEVLGLFALLESPKFSYSSTVAHEIVSLNATNNYSNPPNMIYEIERRSQMRIRTKLDELLKYTFNPAPGINMSGVKIEAALTLQVKTGYEIQSENACGVTFQPLSPVEQNFFFQYSEGTSDYQLITHPDGLTLEGSTYASEFMPLDIFSSWVSSFELKSKQNWVVNEDPTNFQLIQLCLYQNLLGLPRTNPLLFQLKLLVTMPFDPACPACTANETTQLFTFDILPEQMNLTESDLFIPWSLNDNPNMNGTYDLDPTESFGEKIWDIADYNTYGGHYLPVNSSTPTVRAYASNSINIYGSQSKTNRLSDVELIAQNEITVLGDVTIGQGFTLSVQDFIKEISIPTSPVSSEYLATYCSQNGAYRANASRSRVENPSVNTAKSNSTLPKNTMHLWPNPATDYFNLALSKEPREIHVFDSQGRAMTQSLNEFQLSSGVNRINTSSFINGAYQVCIVYLDGSKENFSVMIVH